MPSRTCSGLLLPKAWPGSLSLRTHARDRWAWRSLRARERPPTIRQSGAHPGPFLSCLVSQGKAKTMCGHAVPRQDKQCPGGTFQVAKMRPIGFSDNTSNFKRHASWLSNLNHGQRSALELACRLISSLEQWLRNEMRLLHSILRGGHSFGG